MQRFRFWFQRQFHLLLGRFAEVRELRDLRADYETRRRELYAKELEHRKLSDQSDIARAKAEHELADTKRALEVMTEARLNAERAVEVIRGQMDTLRETMAQSEASMKQMVDFFGLQSCGRQVFGTAPLATRPKEEGAGDQGNGRILGRHLVQQATTENYRQAQADLEKFTREAEAMLKNGRPLPNSGTEYSSTSRAVEEPAA